MASTPIDFTLDVQSPVQRALEGYKQGLAIKQVRQNQEAQEQKKERLAQMQSEVSGFVDKLESGGSVSLEEQQAFGLRYPEMSKQFASTFSSMNEQQRRNATTEMSQIYTALRGGNVDAAKELIETKKQAAINSGDTATAEQSDLLLRQIDFNPKAAELTAQFALGFTDPKNAAELIKATDTTKTDIAREALTLEKEKAITQRLQVIAKNEKDENKRVQAQENVIRKEINPLISDFNKVVTAKGKIDSSLGQDSAAGDLAGIFAFMKVLDPGSTVREGEFANAQNSGGIPDKIRSYYNKAIAGERLSANQRADFLKTSGKLFDEERKTFKSEYDRYKVIAENQGLSDVNVFGDIDFSKFDAIGDLPDTESIEAPPLPDVDSSPIDPSASITQQPETPSLSQDEDIMKLARDILGGQ